METTGLKLKKLILSAMFIAIGLILPFFTGQIQRVGNMLLPMHLPVMLCGLICGPWYGLAAGVITPLLRSVLFGMPPMIPTAVSMALELGTYGYVIGFCYNRSKWKCIVSLYRSLIIAMVCGRVLWGVAMTVIMGVSGSAFSLGAFVSGAVINAIPGIIVQLVLIPAVMMAFGRTKMVSFGKHKKDTVSDEE